MKPLVVEMQAFGPFADRQVIDFRELGSKTFFLIHGPTGSGKTSILDGICFALFGDSSGGEREGRHLRSHHADSDTLTQVSFDFALGADRYRVRRVPEQMRKSRRGGGETRQLQAAELWRVETVDGKDIEQPLASGWSKVTEAVVGLLGFQSQQFRQVIMLPQGKFFEFLKSNSQEREKILQALFGTELYKRIEEALKLSAGEVSRAAEKARTQRQTLLDQAKAESEAALELRRQQQADDLKVRQGAEVASTTAALTAEAGLSAARQSADRFVELDKAGAALQTLLADQPAWAARRAKSANAHQAAVISPYEAAVAELARQVIEEGERAGKLATELAAAAAARSAADAALERERARAPDVDRAITRLAELDALVQRVASLAEMRIAHAAANAGSLAAVAALQTAQAALKTASDAHLKLDTDVQNHRLQAAGVDGHRQAHAQLKARHEQATALAARVRELALSTRAADAAQSAHKTVESAVSEARKRRNEVHQAWGTGQAARLARELVDGDPCPVCGAHEHPAPAHAEGALVLDETLKAAEDALAKADAAVRVAEQRLAAERQAASVLEARVAENRAALGSAADVPATQLKAEADAAQARLAVAQAAATALSTLQASLPGAELAVNAADAAAKAADSVARQAQAKLQQTLGQLTEREAGVPADLADPRALQAARAATEQTREALKQALAKATTAASQAAEKLAETRAQAEANDQSTARLASQHIEKAADLDQRLKVAGFADADVFRAARLDDAKIAALDASIRDFEACTVAAAERHARATADTRDLVRPDLPNLVATHEAAKAAQLTASNSVRDAVAALGTTNALAQSLRQMAESYAALEARYAVVKKVAEVATGSNPQRMSFQRYVLATLLEEVLAATTVRLRVMSRSRYEMRRKVEPVDARAHAGLDLEVFDHYTGTTRPVSTLSGGESFLASLALALGLSDVVQSYAGGIRLDAIFVDEGFGTLDPEALDFAIRALKDLQQSGRLVGIISHVAELKEWIDARLELKSTQTGSVAAFVN